MVVSTRLSRYRQKLQRDDNSSKRPRMEECLPGDALEAVMGHLDREARCTARLVSKTFCAAASAHVYSLTLPSTSKAVSFRRYPHLRHVTVTHSYASNDDDEESLAEEESLAQLDPYLRDLATALTLTDRESTCSDLQTRDFLSQAALMPKLCKLVMKGYVEHEGAWLARCTNLEALVFDNCTVARTIVTLTRLTSLHISPAEDEYGDQLDSAHLSWLDHATNLRNLQALSIGITPEALPLIGNLTGLTGLTMSWDEDEEATFSIAPLTRLTRLRSLSIDRELTESNLGIACSLGSGSLVNLELGVDSEAPADCGRFLTRQTALTRLSLHGPAGNLQQIASLHVELLQCLELDGVGKLDAAGLSLLCRATSLTRLAICAGNKTPHMGLSQALGRLTHLRSLTLTSGQDDSTKFLDLPQALSPLTALTKLELRQHLLDKHNLRALLVLTNLRELQLEWCRLTKEVLPQLGVLTKLSNLRVWDRGISSLARVCEVSNPLREARGLPPLRTNVWW